MIIFTPIRQLRLVNSRISPNGKDARFEMKSVIQPPDTYANVEKEKHHKPVRFEVLSWIVDYARATGRF
ncbi:hypothetical protein QVD17_37820 [Tagetes erecta]|uniref:Uncharacterized protein n=1 Tax=Tagetes erecta TaxID=13708 RepID=A0AAD8NKD1_TARER|nr:hypothetical protein QVD17_37820 [Tagetes erecta]